MQYSIVGNDIALIMHYRALLKRSAPHLIKMHTCKNVISTIFNVYLKLADINKYTKVGIEF